MCFGVFVHLSQSDEDGREEREYIGLEEYDQYLENLHSQSEEDGEHSHPGSESRADGAEHKDQSHEHQFDDMSRQDIGKETDHQGERFGEYPNELEERHKRDRAFKPHRSRRDEEDILPIVLRGEDIDENERDHGEYAGHGEVARHVGSAREDRDESENIIDEDEENAVRR